MESVVSDFLLHLHMEKHLAISTITGYQMAITNTVLATSSIAVGRNPALKSLLQNIEIEQGHHQCHFPEWNLALVLSALTKPPFEPLNQASDQLLTVFLITLASGKCRDEIQAFEHARLQGYGLDTGDSLNISQRCKCWARAQTVCLRALFQHLTVIRAMARLKTDSYAQYMY